MKKYLRMLPLALYPYAYLLWVFSLYFVDQHILLHMHKPWRGYGYNLFFVIAALFQVLVLGLSIYGAVSTTKNDCSASEAARVNLFIKGIQIPAYIFHFIIGLMGTLMSIWGIGLIMLALIVDVITILLTGIHSIGCAVKMNKQGILTSPVAILMGVGSFIFCVDVIIAVIYVIIAREKYPRS